MPEFKDDFSWSRRFLPELKIIVGKFLVQEAPAEEDMLRNTDLIVLNLYPVRVACRVRRHQYHSLYKGEFTIRTDRPKGTRTEMEKIVAGLGDYLIYAFSDPSDCHLHYWSLCNLSVFRVWIHQHMSANGGRMPGTEKCNNDGTMFRAFRIDSLPREFVVQSSPSPTTERNKTEVVSYTTEGHTDEQWDEEFV